MKSINLKKFSVYFLFLAVIGLLSSCGGEKKQESATDEFEDAANEMQGQMEAIIYEIPPPSEVPFIIQSSGADFNPDMVNDLTKAEKYTTTNKIAALNLGVYATDIGYLVTYEKVQEALNYMEASMELAESMGIQNAIDQAMVQKFENNLSEKDTLANIINSAIQNSDDYLKESNRNNIAALVLAGTFIEGLYIATQIVDTYPKEILPDDARNVILTPMIKLILDQEKPLEDMIKLLNNIDDKGDWIEGLINSLEELKTNYETLNIQDQISNNRADLVLSDQTLERITTQIEKVRTTVTY
jgi:hypothetical protein